MSVNLINRLDFRRIFKPTIHDVCMTEPLKRKHWQNSLPIAFRSTAFEQNTWQASSSANTIDLLIVSPIDYLLENYDVDKGFLRSFSFLLTLDLIMAVPLFVYVFARLTFIARCRPGPRTRTAFRVTLVI